MADVRIIFRYIWSIRCGQQQNPTFAATCIGVTFCPKDGVAGSTPHSSTRNRMVSMAPA